MDLDDLADRLDQSADRVGPEVNRTVQQQARLLRALIMEHASGRPGPNVIEDEYRPSWKSEPFPVPDGGGSEVGTQKPQGRRLEFGFVGIDSIGRHYCVDMETEALSRGGWVTHDQIREGDEILTLNPDTWTSEWQPVSHVYRSTGLHDLVLMDSSTFSSLTTADHRWPVQRYYGRKKTWLTDTKTTEQLSSMCRIQRAVPCSNLPATSRYEDALVELVAWFWTEGAYDWGRKDGTPQTGGRSIGIRVSQSPIVNPENVDMIRKALYSLFGEPGGFSTGAHWKETQNRWTKVITFRVDRVGAWMLENIVSRPEKIVAPEFLTSLTKDQLDLFIDRSMRADGFLSQTEVPIMGQKSLNRLRSFEIACALTGQPTTTRVHNQKTGMWATSLLRKSQCNPKANATRTDGKAGRSRYEHVREQTTIWCPTTPNGTWLARRRGTVYYTGNSQPPFPHVEPSVNELSPDYEDAFKDALDRIFGGA